MENEGVLLGAEFFSKTYPKGKAVILYIYIYIYIYVYVYIYTKIVRQYFWIKIFLKDLFVTTLK